MKSVRLLPVVGLTRLISPCIASDFAVSHMFDVVRCYLLQSCFYIAEDFIQPTHLCFIVAGYSTSGDSLLVIPVRIPTAYQLTVCTSYIM